MVLQGCYTGVVVAVKSLHLHQCIPSTCDYLFIPCLTVNQLLYLLSTYLHLCLLVLRRSSVSLKASPRHVSSMRQIRGMVLIRPRYGIMVLSISRLTTTTFVVGDVHTTIRTPLFLAH